jgi:hypothetical protein
MHLMIQLCRRHRLADELLTKQGLYVLACAPEPDRHANAKDFCPARKPSNTTTANTTSIRLHPASERSQPRRPFSRSESCSGNLRMKLKGKGPAVNTIHSPFAAFPEHAARLAAPFELSRSPNRQSAATTLAVAAHRCLHATEAKWISGSSWADPDFS